MALKIFWMFPIDNKKIIFCSYGGRQYSCNPKYLFEYIVGRYGNAFTYIWILNSPCIMPEKYGSVKIIKFMSFQYIQHVLTAGIIIDNMAIKSFLPFRKNQIILYTWHGGGAYKKVNIDAFFNKKYISSMKVTREVSARMVKYVISSCKKFTEVSSKAWAIPPEKFLPIGMPRNDIIFNIPENTIKKVKDYFRLDYPKKIVLYAPTFRGDYNNANEMLFSLDVQDLLGSLNIKFGKDFVFLYRSHHASNKNTFDVKNNNILSASDYNDMQELLCATDVLITDYSSCIWDFSFTYKPCFIYAPDLKSYKEEQGFYTPVEDWPFPFSETNDKLFENILKFDSGKYINAVKKHHMDLSSYENGTATKKLCEILFEGQ